MYMATVLRKSCALHRSSLLEIVKNEGDLEQSCLLKSNEGDLEQSCLLKIVKTEGDLEQSCLLKSNEGDLEQSCLLKSDEGESGTILLAGVIGASNANSPACVSQLDPPAKR
jgi:hypothetical protein